MKILDTNLAWVEPLKLAEMLARYAHKDQKYGTTTHADGHLKPVVTILEDCGYFNDEELLCAGWLHDAAEDTEFDLLSISKIFGEKVANLVLCVTGEGHNRKTRNALIYNRLTNFAAEMGIQHEACTLKLADRIHNVTTSLTDPGKMKMYRKEQEAFAAVVEPHVDKAMWTRLTVTFDVAARLAGATV